MIPPPLRETDVHQQIADLARIGLGGCAVGLHVRNERADAGERITAVKAGILQGCPDFEFVDGGRAIWIELKEPGWVERKLRGEKLTIKERRQLVVHMRLRSAGCPVDICESYDEVVGALRWHGVPLLVQDKGILPKREAAIALAARAEGGR